MIFLKVLFKRGYYLAINYLDGIIIKKYVSYKKNIKLPTMAMDNHKFMGWKIDNGSNEFINENNLNPYKFRYVEIFPVFIKEIFLSYHPINCSGFMDDQVFYENETAVIAQSAFKKTGYYFLGWAKTKNSRMVDYHPYDEIQISSDLDLYPVWYSYKVKFDSNTPTNKKYKYDYFIKGELKQLSKNEFYSQGKIFLGWSLVPEDKTYKYKDCQKVIDLTDLSEITLYAIWETKKNTLFFDSNGGIGSMLSLAPDFGSFKLPPNKFQKKGYIFIGWSTNKSSKSVKYSDCEVIDITSAAKITLYAIWDLIFDENFFGIKKSMSKEEKLRIINNNYIKFNSRISNQNPEIKDEAKAVIESLSVLRQKIKDGK